MKMSKNKILFTVLPVFIALMFVVLALCACSDPGAPEYGVSHENYPDGLSEENYIATLDAFMDGNEDRTTFGKGEELTAEYIQQRLSAYGYANAEIIEFSATLSDGKTVDSRHVRATFRAENHTAETKNVIIAVSYDNRYSSPYSGVSGTRTHGALSDGTSVAAALTLAQYFRAQNIKLDYDISFVFFGGTFYDGDGVSIGVNKYLKDIMTESERKNTVLVVEMRRIGVDHVYAFTDARETKRGEFFDGIAASKQLDIYKSTTMAAALPVQALDGLPYAQWVQDGATIAFFNRGIPTLNLVGGSYECMNLTDAESAANANIGGTEKDTLENLKKLYPDYSQKAMTAMSLVAYGLTDPGFLDAVTYDKENFPNTDVLTQNWIWPLVVAGLVIVVYAFTVLIKFLIEKKHPVVAERPKNIKMAVFGMDYENKDDNSIFVDLKQDVGARDEEIFPGIPNNDKRNTAVIDDRQLNEIFNGMMEDITKDMDEMMARTARNGRDKEESEPKNVVEVDAEKVQDGDLRSDTEEKHETTENSENAETGGTDETGKESETLEEIKTAVKTERADDQANDKKDEKAESAVKTLAPKASTRRTVSAKKSASAPKSASAKKNDGKEEEK